MKSLMKFVCVVSTVSAVSAFSLPVTAFAVANGPVTREQVRSELVQLQKAGYSPVSENITYPQGLLAAEARVAAQDRFAAQDGHNSVGGDASGTTASGSYTANDDTKPRGKGAQMRNSAPTCDGPASFCDLFKGGN